MRRVLGSSYASDAARRSGGSSRVLSPWAVASVGIAVTFPLLFVHGRGWWLPLLAVVVLVLQVPLAWLGQTLFGLSGIALALALTTGLILVVMLAALGSAVRVIAGLAVAGATSAPSTLAAFLLPWALLAPVAGAVVGAAALRRAPRRAASTAAA